MKMLQTNLSLIKLDCEKLNWFFISITILVTLARTFKVHVNDYIINKKNCEKN
jgi:hypothetical protein